jgi:chromosome segregation protein
MSAPPHTADILPDVPAEAPARTLAPRLPAADADAFTLPPFADEANLSPNISELMQQVDEAVGALRARPVPEPAPTARTQAPARSMDGPRHALEAQRQEIADLQNVRDTQHAALERARDEILGLNNTVQLLRAWLEQHEKEKVEKAAPQPAQAQARLEAENAALRAECEQANSNFAELVRQTAELRAAFEAREKEMAAMRARVAALKQELSTRTAGSADLSAAIAEAKTRYYRDFDKRTAQFEAETEKLARTLGAREDRIRTLEDENAQLTARCDGLARNAAEFEASKKQAEEKLEAQAAMVAFLDTGLQAEREATGRKIAALTAELQRERLARAAEAHEAAAVRREIGKLLPRLAREPAPANEPSEPAAGSAANDWLAPPASAAS